MASVTHDDSCRVGALIGKRDQMRLCGPVSQRATEIDSVMTPTTKLISKIH